MIERPPLPALLRALVTALAALVLAWPLTRPAGLVAAVCGAALGSLLAARLAATRVRTAPVLALAAALGIGSALLAGAMVRVDTVARVAGPIGARALADVVLWGAILAAGAFVLRLAAARVAWMGAVEVGTVATAVALSLAPHRGGMVHRPLALADWAIARGSDPVGLLLLLGTAVSVGLALLLLREERRRRLPLHLAALVVIALAVLLGIHRRGIPQPRPAADLGLTGKPRDDASPRPGDSPMPAQPSPSDQGEPTSADRIPHPEGASPRPGTGSGVGTKAGQNNDELPFRDEYSSSGGEAPVAVVLLHDDYSPPSGIYYFRQSVFSQYNGVRLVEAARADVDRDVLDRFPSARVDLPDAPPVSKERAVLPTTVGLLADHLKPFALDSLASLWPSENPDKLRFRRSYEAVSRVPTMPYAQMLGHRAGLAGWTDDQWMLYTDFPRQDPRYAALAQTILETLRPAHRDDPLARAIAVKLWLDKNGTYSRRSQHAGTPDPTADFLFGDRIGYCVHFAHAAAFLLRALDVPTRVAGGYAVEEGRRGTGSALMIRGLDAHAWPEIAIEGVGWVVVDLSPEKTLDPPGSQADQSLQRMLGESLREGTGAPAQQQRTRLPTLAEVGKALIALLAIAVVAAFAVKIWRAAAPLFAPPEQMYRVAYRAALDALSGVGQRRRRGESREAFAARVHPLSPAFTNLTGGHLAAALGSRRPVPADELRRLWSAASREVRRSAPRWRVILGALNPISPLLTR